MSISYRKAATKSEADYHARVRALNVCMVCEYRRRAGDLKGTEPVPGDLQLHHRNIGDKHGQKRVGQDAVVLLCSYHHDDKFVFWGWGVEEMREVYGPSFAHHARDFREWTRDVLPDFTGEGTERWQAYQDQLLEEGCD